MKKFLTEFKDDTDKIILIAVLVTSLFISFLPALITILFLKKFTSENTYNISKAFFNFELFLFLISLIFFIPIVGQILGFLVGWFILPIVALFNIVIIIIDLCALCRKTELIVPVPFEFL